MKTIMQSITKRLATLLLFAAATLMPQVANAAGTKPTKGDGSSSSPFEITNISNLLWFADQVNNKGNGGYCAKLAKDIGGVPTTSYVIGTSDHPFWGEFDGNNKTIGVESPGFRYGPNSYRYAGGVFGCIKAPSGTTAVVKNLTVTGYVNIDAQDGVYYIGGVIGIAYGDVNLSNIISKVDITITNDASYAHCGGIVGSAEWFDPKDQSGNLNVSDCVNYGTINVACGENCGGIVGYIRKGSITDCLNVGNITNSEAGTTGGILGYVNTADFSMSRCLNIGTITAEKAYSVYYKKDKIGTVSNLYYKSGVGGKALTATEVSAESIKDGSVAYLLSSGTWGQSLGNNSVNDAYPYPNKTAYKVYQSGSNYYNNITSTIPTGDFTTTIETTAQYKTNLTRVGDTRSFTVKPSATTGMYIEKVTHNGNLLSAQSVDGNAKTYSYTVALNNDFVINVPEIVCTTTLNQSTMGTAINLADNTLGSTETFTATPNAGYYITGATINGSTVAGTVVSGKTDGTKSFSFTVKESNTVIINTAAIACTTTLNQSTTTLNLADNQIGSTETFTVTPKAGNYVTNVIINGETVAGTAVSGKTDGTKSYSFTVKESNTVTINTAAIAYTKPTGSGFSTDLPDNINDKQIGSTINFIVTPTAGYYITKVNLNDNELTPSATDADGTRHYSFIVSESNTLTISTSSIGYTKPTGSGFTTNLPDVLQYGSTVDFWVKPNVEICSLDVSYNSSLLTPYRTDTDRTKHYTFTVTTDNVIIVTTTPHNYDNDFCTNCGSGHSATLDSDGYYAIADAAQLHWFAEQVNCGETTIKGKLTADITLSGTTNDFVIGTSDNPFKGEFDGGNHTVSSVNVTTAKTGVNNLKYASGLFGCINASDDAATAVVKDLTVEGSVNITGLTTKYYAGGVIGIAYGNVNVSNVISRVDVTTGSNGQKGHCGGVVASGEWFGSTNGNLNVSNCANYGTLNVACADVCGGVIGYIRKGSITDCLNVGDITNSEDGHTSGVLGYVREDGASISRCLNVGSVTNTKNSEKVNPVCHINGTVSTSDLYYKSGVCGTATNATEVSAESLASGEVAWLLNGSTAEGDVAWYQNLSDNADAYPVLDSSHGKVYGRYVGCDSLLLYYSNNPLPTSLEHNYDAYGFCSNCGSFQPATLISEGNYEIANAGQLYWFAEKVNKGNATINARLTADIVVNEEVLTADGKLNGDRTRFKMWTPIGNKYYYGTFDGQGHTISGLVLMDNTAMYIGLFKINASGSIIKNVGLVDSYFYADYDTGGICGRNDGAVENCFNAAKCIANSRSGGIVGYNNRGSIANCYNIGIIDGDATLGGICAYNTGSIFNSYYLEGTADAGIASGSGEATAMTADEFASGEVTWLLNGSEAGERPLWRQTVGEDKYPVLDAASGIVVKTTTESLNSIVRPTAGTLVGASDVYNFAGIEGKKVYGIPQTGTLAASHPYVFTTDVEYVSFVPSDEEVTDNTLTCGLTGVLDPAGKKVYGKDNTAGEDVSIVFTATALKYANPNGNLVKYGKCYIDAGQCFINTAPAMASKIASAFEDGVDGLENVSIDSVEGETYNLQGIPVGDNYKGFIIQNGQKMLRR